MKTMSKRRAEKYKGYGYIHKEKRGFVYTRALLNKARALPADRPGGGGHGGGLTTVEARDRVRGLLGKELKWRLVPIRIA